MPKMFETKMRGDTAYVTLTDDAPEWLRDAIYEAHDGTLPCDWIFAECRDAFESDEDLTDDDACHEYADSAVEVYTGRLFAWAAEHYGTSMFSEAEEQASEVGEGGPLSEQLMRIQFYAIKRIARIIGEAKAMAEETGDDDNQEEVSNAGH